MQNEKVAEEKIKEQSNTESFSKGEVEDRPSEDAASKTNDQNEKSEVEKIKADLAEQKDKYLRLYSDFENFRRRSAKEKIDFIKSANEEIIVALLPVIDDFERALKANEGKKEFEGISEGIKLIYSKLIKTLEQKGLKPMESKGNVFDIELHEAITQIPAPDESLKGKVIDEVEKGYYLNEKVIRFAKVIIGA